MITHSTQQIYWEQKTHPHKTENNRTFKHTPWQNRWNWLFILPSSKVTCKYSSTHVLPTIRWSYTDIFHFHTNHVTNKWICALVWRNWDEMLSGLIKRIAYIHAYMPVNFISSFISCHRQGMFAIWNCNKSEVLINHQFYPHGIMQAVTVLISSTNIIVNSNPEKGCLSMIYFSESKLLWHFYRAHR